MFSYQTYIVIDVCNNTGQRSERNTFKDAVKRKHLASKQDCYNNRKKIGCNAMCHAEDATSVDLL